MMTSLGLFRPPDLPPRPKRDYAKKINQRDREFKGFSQ
jgi:hypothetical protein